MQAQKSEFAVRNTLASSQQARYQGRPEVSESLIQETFVCDGHANQITPQLYLGDRTSASERMKSSLNELHISAVVNCTIDSREDFIHDGLEYVRVAVHDNEIADISVFFDGCSDFINKHVTQGGSVLVHCERGVSRSASIVIAYLIKYHHMSLINAYRTAVEHRRLVSPNIGFWKQLELFEQRTRKSEKSQTSPNEASDGAASETMYDEKWCRKTCAEFQMRSSSGVKINQFEGVNLTNEMQQQILAAGLDYILGRCMVPSDVVWLRAICEEFNTKSSIHYIHNTIHDPEGEFLENWGCEFSQARLRSLMVELGAEESDLVMPSISE